MTSVRQPEPHWVVHFSADDLWRSNPQSRHHIVGELFRRNYRVIWVNSMGMRFPLMRRYGFWIKVARKIHRAAMPVRKAQEHFYVLSPIYIPWFSRGWVEWFNSRLISWQVRLLMSAVRAKTSICLATLPTFAPAIRQLQRRRRFIKVIYYYSDQYDRYREIRDREPILAWDAMLRSDADAIFCASEEIRRNVAAQGSHGLPARLLEHQVDFEHFDYTRIAPEKLDIVHPVIGYFGSLTDSNDWDMISHAARERPEWQFVFIGEKRINLPELESLLNVHFLGFIPYERLPEVAVNFDVGIMLWKMTEWIRVCSPLKLKEYLALGLPVVSVPIDEVRNKYACFVEFAGTGPEFVAAIERALQNQERESRREFASQFSWKAAVDAMLADVGLG